MVFIEESTEQEQSTNPNRQVIIVGMKMTESNDCVFRWKRKCLEYDAEVIEAAIDAVKQGMSRYTAAKVYGITRNVLFHHLHHLRHKNGRPFVLQPNEEQVLINVINQLTQWGFYMDANDIKILIKGYLDTCDRFEIRFKDNIPGKKFIRSFIKRNQLGHCLSSYIQPSDMAMRQKDIVQFNNRLEAAGDILPQNIFQYDEIALSNNPEVKTVMLRRSSRRFLAAVENPNMNISIMICGSASGQFLPPLICYRSAHLDKNWTFAGPTGAVYAANAIGMLEIPTFAFWFERILLKTVKQIPGQKLVIGNHLCHYFTPKIINSAIENNIQFVSLPKSCTSTQRPLGVTIYKSLQLDWRAILINYQKETKRMGAISIKQLAMLLRQLWLKLGRKANTRLVEAFRTTGIYPRNPTKSLKIPVPRKQDPPKDIESIGKALDSALIDLLRDHNRDIHFESHEHTIEE